MLQGKTPEEALFLIETEIFAFFEKRKNNFFQIIHFFNMAFKIFCRSAGFVR